MMHKVYYFMISFCYFWFFAGLFCVVLVVGLGVDVSVLKGGVIGLILHRVVFVSLLEILDRSYL